MTGYCFDITDKEKDDCGDCWPLDDKQLSLIGTNYLALVEILDADDDLLGELTSAECFSQHQLNELRNISRLSDRNSRLLDMLTHCSVAHFKKFIHCVTCTQCHAVPLLTGLDGEYTSNVTWCQ